MSNFLTILKQIKLVILFILATSVAHGQNQSAFLRQFASQAFVIPEKLVQMKKLSVGNIDLKSLIEEMKTLTWSENGGTFWPDQAIPELALFMI